MTEKATLYFLLGAHYWKPILIIIGAAVALFAFFGTIILIWAIIPK